MVRMVSNIGLLMRTWKNSKRDMDPSQRRWQGAVNALSSIRVSFCIILSRLFFSNQFCPDFFAISFAHV